jgi:hypothetical protein
LVKENNDMKYAIIENQRVTNIVVADGQTATNNGWIDATGAAIGDTWDGQTFTKPTPLAPTVFDVRTERDRRLAAGFDYDFEDARGVHTLATTPSDMDKWQEVTDNANALVNLNRGSETINILTETGLVSVTAIEWQSILVGASQFRQPVYQAYFTLKASDPIPADYTDDAHWD